MKQKRCAELVYIFVITILNIKLPAYDLVLYCRLTIIATLTV